MADEVALTASMDARRALKYVPMSDSDVENVRPSPSCGIQRT